MVENDSGETLAEIGNTVTASLDGKVVNTFSSEAFAHPTKRLLRLPVPHSAVVDDVRVMALALK